MHIKENRNTMFFKIFTPSQMVFGIKYMCSSVKVRNELLNICEILKNYYQKLYLKLGFIREFVIFLSCLQTNFIAFKFAVQY